MICQFDMAIQTFYNNRYLYQAHSKHHQLRISAITTHFGWLAVLPGPWQSYYFFPKYITKI